MTLGDYVYKQLSSTSGGNINVQCGEMEVVKPLIANKPSNGPQILQVTVNADLNRHMARLRYAITFEDGSAWVADWASTAYLIHGRIDTLEERLANDKADRISRGFAYKMLATLVQFDKPYQGMENVILDSANFEATSRVSFQTEETDGEFFCSPYWIESLAHLSGFILNGSDAVDSNNYVYISHGWKSLRIGRSLSRTTKYRSYVKMQPAPNNVMIGDVFIIEEKTIIGVVGGLKFQRIPRKVLNTMLPPEPQALPISAVDRHSAAPIEKASVKVGTDSISQQPVSRSRAPKNDTHHRPDLFAAALNIISQETELPLTELHDDCFFADLGVDSLLSLQVSSKMREEFNIDIPNSVFIDHVSIGDFRGYLTQPKLGASSPSLMFSSSSSSDDDEIRYNNYKSNSSVSSTQMGPTNLQSKRGSHTAIMTLFRTTIAEQMGIELAEVVGSNDLLSLGLDSLMTIVILGILREQTGLDLPFDLFLQHPSIDAIQQFLGSTVPEPPQQERKSNRSFKKKRAITKPPTPLSQAVSILIQGKPKNSAKTLYLIPDGSGSATTYATIPTIDPRITVYALKSPFMTTPAAFTSGISGIASLYLAEVCRRQPKGPYHLGGWSAGGVIAYEMTQQILSAGERVESLILLDSPCPLELEPLPSRLNHFFADIGLLGGEGQEIPAWLLPHFEASIKALTTYDPAPIRDRTLAPKTLAIWARYGVCRYPDDPRPQPSEEEDPKTMKWLLENRTDFGFNGWDTMLGEDAMEMTSLECNHFTMMKEPEQMRKFTRIIKKFLL
ncbi:MAG: hypothetical protein Q9166_007751 [cf. Caloplaca sp. 2 TL-2023]